LSLSRERRLVAELPRQQCDYQELTHMFRTVHNSNNDLWTLKNFGSECYQSRMWKSAHAMWHETCCRQSKSLFLRGLSQRYGPLRIRCIPFEDTCEPMDKHLNAVKTREKMVKKVGDLKQSNAHELHCTLTIVSNTIKRKTTR